VTGSGLLSCYFDRGSLVSRYVAKWYQTCLKAAPVFPICLKAPVMNVVSESDKVLLQE